MFCSCRSKLVPIWACHKNMMNRAVQKQLVVSLWLFFKLLSQGVNHCTGVCVPFSARLLIYEY